MSTSTGHSQGAKLGNMASKPKNKTLPVIDAGSKSILDPWAEAGLPARAAVSEEDIVQELKRILRIGLPLNTKRAGDVLPHLRSIIARSIHPYDASSRVATLNEQLVRFVADWGGDEGEAMRVLLAVAAGAKGTTLTTRRERASSVVGYEVDHFRKRVEPRLIEELAQVIYADLLRYKRRVRRAPEGEEPTGDTPRPLTEDDMSHQEELVSRIWHHLYGVRAEVILYNRLKNNQDYVSEAEDARQASGRELLAMRKCIVEYAKTYGESFVMHGAAEYALEGLERLAGIQ